MLTIYKASAGSGKTFTLAYEYIKTLLGIRKADGSYFLNSDATPGCRRLRDRHRAIMAITFTNAATAEMKSRIISEISRLAHIADSPVDGETPYAAMLTAAYGCGRTALREAAALALRELLDDYSGFNVSTIDSFFQTVLRTFSREIDHQGDYELAIDRMDVIVQSLSLMLDELNYGDSKRQKRLFGWVRSYMLNLVGEGGNYNIFDRGGKLLGSLAGSMDKSMDENFVTHSAELRRYLADTGAIPAFVKAMNAKVAALKTAQQAAAKAFLSEVASADLSSADVNKSVRERANLFAGRPGEFSPKTFDLKAVKLLASDGIPLTASDVLLKTPRESLAKKSPDRVEAIAEAANKMFLAALDARNRGSIFRRVGAAAVELEFIGLALHYLETFLKENNTMLISDTGELLGRIISDAEMPFIYERLGLRLENLLIDEFQDTSRLQWHNLRPLVANSLAGGHDNLIIGDVKQAIYRFRNSDPSLLGRTVAEEDFPDSHRMRGHLPADNTNHRSAPDIVRFNNTVFDTIARRLNLPGYETVAQTPSPRLQDIGAYITVEIGKKCRDKAAVYESLAESIRRQHAAGYRWRDILVLVRRRVEGTDLIGYFLEHHPDIRLLSNEALLLSNSPAVRTIMSMLALVERSYSADVENMDDGVRYASRDDIADFNNRFSYHCSLGLDAAAAIEAALAEGADGDSLRRSVREIRAENPANLVALIEAIIHYKLTDSERRGQHAYIAALQDLAMDHVQGADTSVGAFIDAYARNARRWAIQASSDLDAVEIMTIHTSKGLERACVHIPLADWTVERSNEIWIPLAGFPGVDPAIVPPMVRVEVGTDDPLADSRYAPTKEIADFCRVNKAAELLDSINMSYVAFTRAARELCVHGATGHFGSVLLDALTTPGTDSALTIDTASRMAKDEEGGFSLTIGEPTRPVKPAGPSTAETAAPYKVVYRNDARELISIDDILSDDIVTGNECPVEITDACDGTPEMRIAARRGNDMHAILASMDTADDLDAAIERRAVRGSISADEAAGYRSELMQAFREGGEKVASWFSPEAEVYAERSIYSPDIDETFRPDRVVRLADGSIEVIDYKFTTEPRAAHRRQVREYAALISGLEQSPARAYLWYPLLNRIIEVK
ncbi:MAG: UvrD-helicase domain-containing protein [Muribaculaceae bacterium]|nr:UvrD-helicase domain-containing protein [Muribaculaceae bacterium]